MEKMTEFVRATHGFKFANRFEVTIWVGDIMISGAGRCGGMVYAALDYFYNNIPIPSPAWYAGIDDLPPDGHPLGNYIHHRLVKSLVNNALLAIKRLNPLVLTNWYGRGIRGGVDFDELKSKVDNNEPTNIVLITTDNQIFNSHQVCGIGYYIGTGGKHNIKIYLYDPNYPNHLTFLSPNPNKNLFEEWRVRGTGNVQATFMHVNGAAYFFSGDNFLNYAPGIGVVGGVQEIANIGWNNFPRSFQSNLDASIKLPDDREFLFKGDEYISYNPRTQNVSNPRKIRDGWHSFPPSFHNNIDAALMYSNGLAFFFKDDKYIVFEPGGRGVIGGIKTIGVNSWKSFPPMFHNNLDAALMYSDGYAYFFKGDRFIKYKPNRGVIGGVQTIGVSGWTSLPVLFSGVDKVGEWKNYFVDSKYRSEVPPQPGNPPPNPIDWSNTDHSRDDLNYRDMTHYILQGTNLDHALLKGCTLAGVEAQNANFNNANITSALLAKMKLKRAKFNQADLRSSTLDELIDSEGIDFTSADLRDVKIRKAKCERSIFKLCALQKANFTEATLDECNFEKTIGNNTIFIEASLVNSSFKGANLADSSFKSANLSHASFQDAKLTNVNFSNSELHYVDFTGADLANCRWYLVKSVFRSDIDAAILYPDDCIHFFKGEECIKYDHHRGIQGPVKKISDRWVSFPASFHKDIDAALMFPDGCAYFFKGDEFIKFQPGQGRVGNARKISAGWPWFPQYFHSDLDAAILYSDTVAYFFKGSKCIKLQIGMGVEGGEREIHAAGWNTFHPSFYSNLDAAVISSNDFAYFFKGDRYIKFNPENRTASGVRTIGSTGWVTFP